MRPSLKPALVIALCAAMTAPLTATTARQFNLAEMSARAQKIYVGTVQSATAGTVAIGGGQLAVVTYQLNVDEDLRGATPVVKGLRMAEIRVLGKQASAQRGTLRSVSPLPDMPVLTVGQTYLVFTTPPSAVGLSATVGLGQGCFRLSGQGPDRMAVNEVNNIGLFRGMAVAGPGILAARASTREPSGPFPYAALRAQILTLIGAR
jgi:hypothetical protein